MDLGVLKKAGFSVATKNACADVKNIVTYVTKKNGGRGAVREVAELILKTKGLWPQALRIFQ